ncbi:MAG: hypothetical protein QMD36_06490 [Candidatus Aenigmarchaeota archaeon]|nr:hypothetical protein [Candidatus Aenigmarchaeota archaeon]
MEKLRVYLDTNTLMDFFMNQAKALKKKKRVKTLSKLRFFIENSDKLEFITSVITKAEIIRELVSAYV